MQRPTIGGWYLGRIQLSTFVRDFLSNGEESWAHEIYMAYKRAAEGVPLQRGKGKRKVISYHGFLDYMYMLRKLGLIEYLMTATGEVDTEEATGGGGVSAPYLAPKRFIKAVISRINDPAWQNPHQVLYG